MKTPKRIKPEELSREIQLWVDQKCSFVAGDHGEFCICCRDCGGEIEHVRTFISLHDERFESCAGWGRVLEVPIPYCPGCEPRPEEQGCFHCLPPENYIEKISGATWN